MINLLMFDLDGTLFDTAPGIVNAFNRVLADRGEGPVPAEIITRYIGTGLRDLLTKLDDKLTLKLGDIREVEEAFHRHYAACLVTESFLYPGLTEFLLTWPHKLAVVSNKNEGYVRELIARTPLRQFQWTSLIGGNSFPVKKPHPRPLLEAIQEAGVKPENALMIGDGLPDMLAAQQAQVKSVAISFGYTPLSDLIHSGAHAAISHYEELPKVIRALS